MAFSQKKYQSKFGEIRFSKAENKSHFKGITKGIALKYVIKGKESYCINQQHISLESGQFILLRQDKKYDVKFENKKNSIDGICIDLHPQLLSVPDNFSKNDILFNTLFECNASTSLGAALSKNAKQESMLSNVDDVLSNFSAHLLSFSDEVFQLQIYLNAFAKKTETKRSLLAKLMLSKNYIYKNYNQKITLHQLSIYAGISKFHFLRLFKYCFQKSPFELQEILRMQKAKELIKEQNLSLTEIAFYLGYLDLASFSKQFKKCFGASPSQFTKSL